MTVMSKGVPLNSKIKWVMRRGGFEAFFTEPPLVIVYQEFNRLTVIHYVALRWSEMSKSISCQTKAVSTLCQANM